MKGERPLFLMGGLRGERALIKTIPLTDVKRDERRKTSFPYGWAAGRRGANKDHSPHGRGAG